MVHPRSEPRGTGHVAGQERARRSSPGATPVCFPLRQVWGELGGQAAWPGNFWGVGSCQPARPGRACPPPTCTCPEQESCACSNVAQAGSCCGVCLADVGKVPHRPWMSPPATCHPASNSTTREVCLGFHERPFWAWWRVGTSPREGTPTGFPSGPSQQGSQPSAWR